MKASRIVELGSVAGAGALCAYFADPARGRARRARIRDQARARLRRDVRAAGRRARLLRGRLDGVAHRVAHRSAEPPASDRVLVDKVRSEVLGRRPMLAHRITLDAADGVVTLRGECEDSGAIDELAAAVREVAGVNDVRNLLHAPGEPAANKADARRVHL